MKPVYVFGATGYVGGELLRLLALHPEFELAGAVSGSQAGKPVASVFPHLLTAYGSTCFVGAEEGLRAVAGLGEAFVFLALPHGESARVAREILAMGKNIHLVDLSADFRFQEAVQYEKMHGHPHPTPELLGQFVFGHPELLPEVKTGPVAHPGCFTTSVTLAVAPLLAAGAVGPNVRVSAVTGSTGSGREPKAATHHPDRHGNVRAYNPLRHRHADEMSALLGRVAGAEIDVRFVPHSGNFARGILSTIFLDAQTSASEEELIQMVNEMYAPKGGFVTASAAMPSVKDVVGTNQVRVGVVREGDQIVLTSALDNLTKGASGGAMQWMNRLAGLDDTAGLKSPGWGWN